MGVVPEDLAACRYLRVLEETDRKCNLSALASYKLLLILKFESYRSTYWNAANF